MGWAVGDRGFKIVLSAAVPEMVRAHLEEDVTMFLRDHGLTVARHRLLDRAPGRTQGARGDGRGLRAAAERAREDVGRACSPSEISPARRCSSCSRTRSPIRRRPGRGASCSRWGPGSARSSSSCSGRRKARDPMARVRRARGPGAARRARRRAPERPLELRARRRRARARALPVHGGAPRVPPRSDPRWSPSSSPARSSPGWGSPRSRSCCSRNRSAGG